MKKRDSAAPPWEGHTLYKVPIELWGLVLLLVAGYLALTTEKW